VGQRVRVVPSKLGTAVSARKTATAIVAGIGTPQIEPVFEPSQPDITTREARAMRIRRVVSEFTTPYPCCAPRVTNIQRAAEILDGYVIRPGGRFSLNEALGERTAERGFVMAPMITAGRLVDAIGGGVSQVATTFYNAAFFAGLELIAHTPHEFYISRYPMGREATVSWGGPELIFRNDWPVGILVQVIATDTSITVRFYSSKLGRRVETETGEPYAYTSASTIRVYNPALPPGTETTVQFGGITGFTVAYTRRVYRGDKLTRDEEYVVRYLPENTIVEYGPAAPQGGSGGAAGGGGGDGSAGGASGGDGGAGAETGSGSSAPPPEEPAEGSGSGEPPPPP
jgi:vancomycin resistance protein YoaR